MRSFPHSIELTKVNPNTGSANAGGSEADFEIELPAETSITSRLSALKSFNWNAEHLIRDRLPVLVAGAVPIIELAHSLRFTVASPDLQVIRRDILLALARYEQLLENAHITRDEIVTAHYLVCASIDDSILSTKWGQESDWAQFSLASSLHTDVASGEHVFERLTQCQQSPKAHSPLLFLFYICFSLGFMGKLRISPSGGIEHDQIREKLAKSLIPVFGRESNDLSPQWHGENVPIRRFGALTILAVCLFSVLLCAAVGYFEAIIPPSPIAERIKLKLAQFTSDSGPKIQLEAPVPTVPASRIALDTYFRPRKLSRIECIARDLRSEIENRQITISDDGNKHTISAGNKGLFASGSAEINPDAIVLLQKIGQALSKEELTGAVVGYTDNIPISNSKYPSNWYLSAARAKAVGSVLSEAAGKSAFLTEGRADSEPLGNNSTAEGRQENRRTEIVVFSDGEPGSCNQNHSIVPNNANKK
ncbi:MAG: type IVB secretion system protein IcmH/DotU [Brucella intermedia]